MKTAHRAADRMDRFGVVGPPTIVFLDANGAEMGLNVTTISAMEGKGVAVLGSGLDTIKAVMNALDAAGVEQPRATRVQAEAKGVNDRRRTAVHEAGHAVLGRVLDQRCDYATIEPDDESAGHVITADPWDTYGDVDDRYQIALMIDSGMPVST